MSKVIYEEATYREIPESMVVSQIDDAWHPLKDRNYIEWWYFDAMNQDGSLLRGQIYIAGNIARPKSVTTGIRASYVGTDGSEIVMEQLFPYSAFRASADVCDVQLGPNFIRGDISSYRIHMESGGGYLDLELESEIDGITSFASFGDESHYMYWVVPQPRGQARGVFHTGEVSFPIDGLGYRDHNWLNIPPMDLLAYWDWGRIYDEEYTVIFADIVTTKKMEQAEIKPLTVFDSKQLVYLTTEANKWSLSKSDLRTDPQTGLKIPFQNRLEAHDDRISMEINLELKEIFQRIDLLANFNPLVRLLIRTFKAKPTITSFFSTGKGTMGLDGRSTSLECRAVHELVKNR